ncbi:hypothetical protein ACJW31_04G079500 [Castanea mollissima]
MLDLSFCFYKYPLPHIRTSLISLLLLLFSFFFLLLGLHILPSHSIFFINFIFALTRIHVSKHPSMYLTANFLRSDFSFHLEANMEITSIASIRKDTDCKAERV